MGNNKRTTSNDILVKVDQNNLMYIDPDSVVSNGVIEQRNVEQENLAMFVNLEADLIPRTILISDNSTNTLTSIAKGTLNMLTNSIRVATFMVPGWNPARTIFYFWLP